MSIAGPEHRATCASLSYLSPAFSCEIALLCSTLGGLLELGGSRGFHPFLQDFEYLHLPTKILFDSMNTPFANIPLVSLQNSFLSNTEVSKIIMINVEKQIKSEEGKEMQPQYNHSISF